ncbi:hypothetical protein [Massilia sp. TWR1-2-2]|uniref:hypothetical protein n=1 Tax=Massilia sp. TWR1-2-2 TaxID=2804584 RepID=UPI003CF00F7A
MSTLPGRAVYGVEFASNFAPVSGDMFFLSPKRVWMRRRLSVCYLVPKLVQGSCARPGVADAGNDWQLSMRTPKQVVYVLVAPWQGQG